MDTSDLSRNAAAQRLSGLILDRIDLHVSVDVVEHEKLLKNRAAKKKPIAI